MKHAFTVDLEDWYQGIERPFSQWEQFAPRVEIGVHRLLDLLDEGSAKATFFALGWIGEKHPDLIKEIARRGHELGSHGRTHEKLYNLSPEDFREEIRSSKSVLESLSGKIVRCFRAPFFTVTKDTLWSLDILAEEGYTIDCSMTPVKTWRYGLENCPHEIFRLSGSGLIEFPASTFRLLGKELNIGGAYFRIFPYFLSRDGLRAAEKAGKPGMFYSHPWEYDAEHPRVEMEWKAGLTHYARLSRMGPNTRKLLSEFDFAPVGEIVDEYARSQKIRDIDPDIFRH